MGRLLLVEVRRALARGITRLLPLAGAVIIVAVGILVFLVTQDGETRRTEAKARYDRMLAQCLASPPFISGPGGPGGPGTPGGGPVPDPGSAPSVRPDDVQQECERYASFVLEQAERNQFELVSLWPELPPDRPESLPAFELLRATLMLPGLILLLGALVAGASMIGADWQAGSFTMLLTWEPRRHRVLLARMLATALVGTVIAAALLALFTAVLVPTAALKGTMPPSTDWWVTYVGAVLRLSGLVGLTAAVGAALAMIGKRTVLALFAVIGYLIAGEVILQIYWETARPWLLLRNVALFMGGEEMVRGGDTALQGLLVLGVWSAIVTIAALVLFGRRDFASSG